MLMQQALCPDISQIINITIWQSSFANMTFDLMEPPLIHLAEIILYNVGQKQYPNCEQDTN